MLTTFEALIMGHVLGDYFFQNNWMAQRKGSSYFSCVVHCLIYTFFVCAMVAWNPYFAAMVFVSHFFVDKWSLADSWLRVIRGRTLTGFLTKGHVGTPKVLTEDEQENYCILRGGFTAVVYVIADNAFHIMLMLIGIKYLKQFGLM